MARRSRRKVRGSSSRSKPRGKAPLILPSSPPLDSARLKQLYSAMLGCRILVESTRVLTSEGLFPADTSVITGHEALEVGTLIHLIDEDCLASPGRGYVARFIRGHAPRSIFSALCNRTQVQGHNGERNVDSVLPGSTLAAQMSQLTGAAWAFKLQKRPQVALFLSGDRSSSGDWLRDSVRLSATYKLPIVHVIENTHGDRLHAANPDRGSGSSNRASFSEELPCFVVDANDAVAVYRVAQEAIRRARQGHGPALIECRTWAAPSRSGSTTALAYDGREDPLARMEAHLRSKNLWSDRWRIKLVEQFTRQLHRASVALRPGCGTPIVCAAPTVSPAGIGLAKTAETNVFDPVIRDSSRLAGGRS